MNKPSHFKFRQILHFVLANRRNGSTGHQYLFICLKLSNLSKFEEKFFSVPHSHESLQRQVYQFLANISFVPQKTVWGHSSCPAGSWPGSFREPTKQTEVNFILHRVGYNTDIMIQESPIILQVLAFSFFKRMSREVLWVSKTPDKTSNKLSNLKSSQVG